ncbi:MAG: YHS domain-containing (seleno)protein [Chitinophagaceae bacterium]|nr:YHS domain-containing (seleno)protein [Chitinophagaceae bacterium]
MKLKLVLMLLPAFAAYITCAQDATALRKKHFNLSKGVAIEGYDPVAYFTQNKAIEGKKEMAFAFEGATYYFSSEQNREEFKKHPSKYEPAYGGWCAYAMGAEGDKVDINPQTFKIVNGKLNLFYNKYFNNTLTKWNKDEVALKAKAEQNWQKTFR